MNDELIKTIEFLTFVFISLIQLLKKRKNEYPYEMIFKAIFPLPPHPLWQIMLMKRIHFADNKFIAW